MSDRYLNHLQEVRNEDDILKAIAKTKQEYKKKRRDIKEKINDARIKYSEYSEKIGHTIAKEIIGTFEDDLVKLQNNTAKKLAALNAELKYIRSSKGAKFLTVSAIIIASYHLYKVYIRDYRKKCESEKGFDKILCYRKARLLALQHRIQYLKNSMNEKCNKTKDPTKCKIRISNEIASLTIKLEKYRELL